MKSSTEQAVALHGPPIHNGVPVRPIHPDHANLIRAMHQRRATEGAGLVAIPSGTPQTVVGVTIIALLTLLIFAFSFSPVAHAETITLPCEADFVANQKRLIKAIDAANSTEISDTIVLTRNCAYYFGMPLAGSAVDALPMISQTLTIEGNGTTIGAIADATELRFVS